MGCLNLLFMVALVSGFIQDGHGMKPKMIPEQDTILIDHFQELKIECYSKDARLQFSFPESTLTVPRSKPKIDVSQNGTYTFRRRHAITSDTGWYACAEEGVKIDNDYRNVNHTDKDVSWIYVYVSSGGRASFANLVFGPTFTKTIISVPGSVVVIPFRPIEPTRDVELWQNFRLVDLEKEAVRFDPKIGFIMKQVEFLDNEAIFDCKSTNLKETYILLHSESRPTMITPEGDKDVTLHEGDVLRIECFSESKLSFLYPTILTNSSKHDIVENENGTSTFLRHSVTSDDTGWYGCAGIEIRNNDIPEYSINFTKKDISWVYVYVDSPVKIISSLMDTVLGYEPANNVILAVIPCRPTTPESNIQLEKRNGKIWNPHTTNRFDPKVGFIFFDNGTNQQSVFRCAMTEPVRYVSKDYNLTNLNVTMKLTLGANITDVDNPSNSDDLVIRKTGDDLRMRCKIMIAGPPFRLMKWTVPNTVSANRIKYNRTRSDGRTYLDVINFRTRTFTITVTNLSETDSGKYICSVLTDTTLGIYWEPDSRTVEVFDDAEWLFLEPDKQVYRFTITGRNGKPIKWLLDMTHFPSAEIPKRIFHNHKRITIRSLFEIKTVWKHGAPLLLFSIRNLTAAESGSYEIHLETMPWESRRVEISVDVQEPPTVRLNSTKRRFRSGEMRIDARCQSFESPEPNITMVIKECPKYPSSRNCNLQYGRKIDNDSEDNRWKMFDRQFNISMSGILTCEACNILGCSVAGEHILFYAADKPYFTSTNLNKTEVVLDMVTKGSSHTFVLECYAAGNPYPNLTWFEDDVKLEDSRQHRFAFDNRQLSITYYFGDEGGRYTCRAENVHGHAENYIDIRLPASSDQKYVTVVITVFVTLLVIIIICCIVIYRLCIKASRKKLADLGFKKGAPERFNPELSVVDQAELLPYDLKWEYPRGLLKLDKTLGSGAFGIVRKAEATSICRGEAVTTVAVKMVRSTASLNFMTALTRELKILAYLGKHPNVVNLLGACTRNVFYGELYVIVEYCRFGNLRDHLLNGRDDFVDQIRVVAENMDYASRLSLDCANTNCRGVPSTVDGGEGSFAPVHRGPDTDVEENSEANDDDCDRDHDSGEAQRFRSKYEGDDTNLDLEPIFTRDLVYWSWQVSRGMEFLGQRKIVHGDLAARNILLADNGIVKVCDFGLAKALYNEAEYRDQGGNPLPVKWMAIESIKDLVFSVQSDVWSFGIVMWEIFSLGETPYPGMRQRGLVQKLIDGYRMGHPKFAEMTVYDIMKRCWDADPAKRPSFNDMSHNLCGLLDDGFKMQYLEMHARYMEINAEALNDRKEDYLTMSPSAIAAASSSKVGEQIELHNLPQDVAETPV